MEMVGRRSFNSNVGFFYFILFYFIFLFLVLCSGGRFHPSPSVKTTITSSKTKDIFGDWYDLCCFSIHRITWLGHYIDENGDLQSIWSCQGVGPRTPIWKCVVEEFSCEQQVMEELLPELVDVVAFSRLWRGSPRLSQLIDSRKKDVMLLSVVKASAPE